MTGSGKNTTVPIKRGDDFGMVCRFVLTTLIHKNNRTVTILQTKLATENDHLKFTD